jgi:hypothetical protein
LDLSDDLKASDLAGATESTLKLVVEESDKRLAAQVQVMLAVDSRSNSLLSVSATLASAAFGVAAAQVSGKGLSPLVVGAAGLSATALAAAFFAISALRPRALHTAGWSPVRFKGDIEKGKSATAILAEMAAHNQSKINENTTCNATISKRVEWAMRFLAGAPMVGAALATARFFWPCA